VGQPGEERDILLGHFLIWSLILRDSPRASPPFVSRPGDRSMLPTALWNSRRPPTERGTRRREKDTNTRKPSQRAPQNQARAKETGKETVRIGSGWKGNNEGDGQVTTWTQED
jgi:hypothetical protein